MTVFQKRVMCALTSESQSAWRVASTVYADLERGDKRNGARMSSVIKALRKLREEKLVMSYDLQEDKPYFVDQSRWFLASREVLK